jgi:hypothetical protein
VAPSAASASTWTVNSCDGDLVSGDVGTKTGTLRFAVAHAIDTGNYVFGGPDRFDQRGSAAVNGSTNYVRVSGLTLKGNIGAYEVQRDDVVFDADFEGCPSP